jgi:hypothetical protein
MAQLRATTRLSFGERATGREVLSVEVDSRPEGLNSGRTSFDPGDTAYILIYKSENVKVKSVRASTGSVVTKSVGTVEKESDVFFDDANEGVLDFPATSIDQNKVVWMGTSLGSLSLQPDGVTVKSAKKGLAVARVTYKAAPEARGIVSPKTLGGLESFSINVLVEGLAG